MDGHPLPFTRCAPGGLPCGVAADPWVSLGPDGTAYASALVGNLSPADWGVAASHDQGRSRENPQSIMRDRCRDVSDKESIIADPSRLELGGGVSEPTWFARTTDAGRSWSSPRRIPQRPDPWTTGNQIVADPRSDTLYDIFTMAIDPPAHRPQCQIGTVKTVCPRGPEAIRDVSLSWRVAVLPSPDEGKTWSPPTLIARDRAVGVPARTQRIRTAAEITSAAFDPSTGDLAVVWQDGRFSHGACDEIGLATSTGGGRHWTKPVRVNRDTSWPAFTAAVTIDARGMIGVSFYRIRSLPLTKPTLPTDYWFTWSSDGGRHFAPETRLADPFKLLAAPDSDGPFLGDCQGLTAVNDSFMPLFAQPKSGASQNLTTIVSRMVTPHTSE